MSTHRVIKRDEFACVHCKDLAANDTRIVWKCKLCGAYVRSEDCGARYIIRGGDDDAAIQAMYRLGGMGAVADLEDAS